MKKGKATIRFKDKSVVITGGSSGIGEATVRIFARGWTKVMVSGLSEQRCKQSCDEMATLGNRAETLTGDFAEKSYCKQLIFHTAKTFGGNDFLINKEA